MVKFFDVKWIENSVCLCGSGPLFEYDHDEYDKEEATGVYVRLCPDCGSGEVYIVGQPELANAACEWNLWDDPDKVTYTGAEVGQEALRRLMDWDDWRDADVDRETDPGA